MIFRGLGEKTNFIYRIKKDGSGRRRIFNLPITELLAVSPDGTWIIASMPPSSQDSSPNTLALPVDGSAPRKICDVYCRVRWAPDGKFVYMIMGTMETGSAGRALAIPVPPGRQLPDLPTIGIEAAKLPGVLEMPPTNLFPGPDPSTYVFTVTHLQRNLFRIPLH